MLDEAEEKKKRPRRGGSRPGRKKFEALAEVGGSYYVVELQLGMGNTARMAQPELARKSRVGLGPEI
jgi:hypothetical protein